MKINCPECKREVNVEYDEDDTRWKGNCVECKLSLSCSDPVVEMVKDEDPANTRQETKYEIGFCKEIEDFTGMGGIKRRWDERVIEALMKREDELIMAFCKEHKCNPGEIEVVWGSGTQTQTILKEGLIYIYRIFKIRKKQ